jgi:hypothetical protein
MKMKWKNEREIKKKREKNIDSEWKRNEKEMKQECKIMYSGL